MKKIILVLSTLMILQWTNAQEAGIKFEHGLLWKQIVEKATKEHKSIFVDCYTTWCGPCKYMSSTIFPMKEVGDFFNKNFICVKAQMDTSKKDDENTIAWRADAAMLEKKFLVHVYPTFLYFSSNGNPLHRSVGAGGAPFIIKEGNNALDSNKAYYTIKNKFDHHKLNSDNAFSFVMKAYDLYDDHADAYAKEYIRTQPDSTKMLDFLKLNYYEQLKMTDFLIEYAFKYISKYPDVITNDKLNDWAWNSFVKVTDKDILKKALAISKQSFAVSNAPEFMDTYAQLLYKTGNKEEAIKVEQKAMDKADKDKESYQKTIDNMKADKKTWEAQ